MKRLLGKLLIIICTGVLVGVCVAFYIDNQRNLLKYERCIEVVKMYKNANERMR